MREPDQIRRAVRDRVAGGADVIKIMASGGVITAGTDTSATQFSDEALAAAVEEAHTQASWPVHPPDASPSDTTPSWRSATRALLTRVAVAARPAPCEA